jgi:hypothetical protein
MADQRVVPINCYRPIGDQADRFVSELSEKHREKLRRFVDTEAPANGESFVWIRDDATMQVLQRKDAQMRSQTLIRR